MVNVGGVTLSPKVYRSRFISAPSWREDAIIIHPMVLVIRYEGCVLTLLYPS